MKLFNRGSGTETPAAEPAGPAPAPLAPTEAPAAAPAEPAAGDVDAKLALALDRSVKDIAEKLARLSSSVENVREERAQFDEKIGKMEERMRKLTALTEMISSQYNPFLGSEPPAASSALAAVQPVSAARLAGQPAPPGRGGPSASASAVVQGGAAPAPWPGNERAEPEDERPEAPASTGPFLTRVDNSFQNSMTLLQWSEMLLRAGGRDGLPDLLAYYQQLGWIGPDVRDLVATYAKGLEVDGNVARGDWRARVDLHEKSLVFVEKLRNRTR